MPDEDLQKQKQAAQKADEQFTEGLARSNWIPLFEGHKTLSKLMHTARDQVRGIASSIDPGANKAAKREAIIAFHDTVRDLRDEIGRIKEGRGTDSQRGPGRGPGNTREPTPPNQATVSALNQMLSFVNTQATAVHSAGLYDPLAERKGYPGTPAEAEEYAITALRQANKAAAAYNVDLRPAMEAARRITNDNGELQQDGLKAFREAMDQSAGVARARQQTLRGNLQEKEAELRKLQSNDDDNDKNKRRRSPPPNTRQIDRLKGEMETIKDRMTQAGRLTGDLQKIESRVNAATREKSEKKAEKEPLVLDSPQKALRHLFDITSAHPEDPQNLDLESALHTFENKTAQEEIRRAFNDISHHALTLSAQEGEVKKDNLKPIREALDKIHLRLRVIGSDESKDQYGQYSDKDREGAGLVKEYLKAVEEVVDGVESKKYGMTIPAQGSLAALVPDDMREGPRFAALDVAEHRIPAGGPVAAGRDNSRTA